MEAKLFLFWFPRFIFRFNVVIISNQFPTHIYLPHNLLTNWSQGAITLIVLQNFWKREREKVRDRQMGREKNTWQRDMQTDKQVGRQTDRQNSSLITFWAIAERGYFIYSSHNKAGTKFIWYDLVKKVLLLIQKISFSWLYACLIKDVNVFITCLIKTSWI